MRKSLNQTGLETKSVGAFSHMPTVRRSGSSYEIYVLVSFDLLDTNRTHIWEEGTKQHKMALSDRHLDMTLVALS